MQNGSRLGWLLIPAEQQVTIYRPYGSVETLNQAEALRGEDVLPGFALPLAEIFHPWPL